MKVWHKSRRRESLEFADMAEINSLARERLRLWGRMSVYRYLKRNKIISNIIKYTECTCTTVPGSHNR